MSSDLPGMIRDFYQAFYNDKDLQKARSMMADDLNNHHPRAGVGADNTIDAIQIFLFTPFPEFSVEIKRIAEDGDLVWVHSYTRNDATDPGSMAVDIWRITDGKIAEHWDVVQPVPDGVDPISMYD